MPVSVVVGDLTRLPVDAIVNAANTALAPGGGVCGAIFAAAGYGELDRACRAIGGCPTGQAVLTPGFALPAARRSPCAARTKAERSRPLSLLTLTPTAGAGRITAAATRAFILLTAIRAPLQAKIARG